MEILFEALVLLLLLLLDWLYPCNKEDYFFFLSYFIETFGWQVSFTSYLA